MSEREPLIPKHGGYRTLKSFQVAQLAYDVTVQFCERYIDQRSRTKDQMVQAARSGVANIAEGSQTSGTSKKFELKLTSVARASLEELRLDYEGFLRQRSMPLLPHDHPALMRFKKKRCATLQAVQAWVRDEHGRVQTDADNAISLASSALAANAALSLLNLACYLLDQQIAAQAKAFEEEGGFTERLYRVRTARRRNKDQGQKRLGPSVPVPVRPCSSFSPPGQSRNSGDTEILETLDSISIFLDFVN
jgi:four helix bundle suffix protein